MLVKNELNLFTINSLFVTILSPSLKNNGNDFLLLVLLRISLMIFQVPLMSSLNFEKYCLIIIVFSEQDNLFKNGIVCIKIGLCIANCIELGLVVLSFL